MGGTFDEAPSGDLLSSTAFGSGTVGVRPGGACTLLGPEGPGAGVILRLGLLGPSFMPAWPGAGWGPPVL